MKNLFLTLTLCISIYQVQAQRTVNFSGQIKNANSAETIYIGLDGSFEPLQILKDETFSFNTNIQQLPSFFYFVTISKKGKIEQQTSRIWFDKDSIEVKFDWSSKSLQMQNLMSFQSISEEIESLKGKTQIEFILNNPVNIASIYFVNRNKENISIPDLIIFSQKINQEYKALIHTKRIDNYISAKKQKPIKIGDIVEDFRLPDKDGNQISIIKGSGKTKLISFFSSGCYYSIASISLLEQLAKLNNNKIEIITLWDDQTKDAWLNAHQTDKSKIFWTNLWDEYGFASTYLNNTSWPTFYVINEEGKLIDIFKSYNQKTSSKLRTLLK